MYNLPELYHAEDHLHPVDPERLDVILQEDVCLWKSEIPCDHDLFELCVLTMEEHDWQTSQSAPEAVRLYKDLRPLIRALLL